MQRLKALIAYDGTSFYGWQIQKNRPTIQAAVQEVLQHICHQKVQVTAAGRTDTGVHACGQVAHFDWDHPLAVDKLILAMNGLLPSAIRVLALETAPLAFHARFDALSKSYFYRLNRTRFPSPFAALYSLHYSLPLDKQLLDKCARTMEGEHDFVAFQATGSDIVTTRRNVLSVELFNRVADESHDDFLYIRIHATGFLRKMMRMMVGTMIEIASGKRPFEHLPAALESLDRKFVGKPVPARGLFLEKVYY